MWDNGQYTFVNYEKDNLRKNVIQEKSIQELTKDNTSVSSENLNNFSDINKNHNIKIIMVLGLLWTIFTKL